MVCNFHQMWTFFSHYVFKCCFHSFLFFWNSSYKDQLILSHMSVTCSVTLFSLLYSLHHILDNFYCYVLKFTDLFFCTANLLLISLFFTSKVLVQSFSYLSLMLVFLMSVYNLFITVILLSLSANLTAFYWLIFLLVTIIFSCFSACLVIFTRCWTLKLFYTVGCWILQHHFKYSWGFVLEMQLGYPESDRAGVQWPFSPWLIQPHCYSDTLLIP